MNAPAIVEAGQGAEGFVSVTVAGHSFGVPVLEVQDVIMGVSINPIPLAPAEIAGSLNLRGRIVTAIEMRRRLGLAPRGADERFLCLIVERSGELYALLFDDVGDVLWLTPDQREAVPSTLAAAWRELTSGLYRLEEQLMLVLQVDGVLRPA